MSERMIRQLYERQGARHAWARKKWNRPLTLAEKILTAHGVDPERQAFERGKAQLELLPDRVAMQDATAQMALLQFMQSGRRQAAVPATIHCDHLIRAQSGAEEDLKRAVDTNREVYDFLQSAAKRYGIGFWKPGSGIIHQVILEHYAFPGGLMIGTDSHTPNAGGLGMLAIGVGGADAAEVLSGLSWTVLHPKLIGVKLTGKLSGWTSPKDVIVHLLGLLTVKGGTNRIVEYFGPGVSSISCTGKGTITNMGAELGATTSVFPYDDRMDAYLRATHRAGIADQAGAHRQELVADPEVERDPGRFYDQVVEIDLSKLEPQVCGPHSPDVVRPISKLAEEVRGKGYPAKISAALIGSCTNSSFEDIGRSAHVAAQARKAGLKARTYFLITPGSEGVFETARGAGYVDTLREAGGTVLANACGPCIGQWKRDDIREGESNSILSSFNRNFPGRNDGNADTLSFISSPEVVTALAFAGDLSFNPLTDSLPGNGGKGFRFSPPEADDLPKKGYAEGLSGYEPPAENGSAVQVKVDPKSERLQLLQPFDRWDGKDLIDLSILVKTRGKTTTDHISPAGPWLKYRGHLDKISDNMFLGAQNAFTGERGKGSDLFSREAGVAIAQLARRYKKRGASMIVIGDENYGEGSSREHAAMSPRYLGVRAVLVRSFARIHETNLKKQGILPLVFENPADYDQFEPEDRVGIVGLSGLAPGKPVEVRIRKKDGREESIRARHSLTEQQIGWFEAGSALNAAARA
jgi:aconitate hydratase